MNYVQLWTQCTTIYRLDNLEEMDKSQGRYKQLKLMKEEI